jgi:hypothetical protein
MISESIGGNFSVSGISAWIDPGIGVRGRPKGFWPFHGFEVLTNTVHWAVNLPSCASKAIELAAERARM